MIISRVRFPKRRIQRHFRTKGRFSSLIPHKLSGGGKVNTQQTNSK